MQQLDTLIEKLNNDNYTAISVFDLESQSFLYRNLIHAEIMTQFGSGEDFFESLFENGNRKLRLTLKRKNGSTYRLDGLPFEVNFSSNMETVNPVETIPVAPTPVQELFPNNIGLGTLDIMNLMVSKNDAQRLFTENEVLKSENKEQKKLIEELKEERLASKYDTEKSKGNQEMLLGAIQQLPTLVSFVKGQPLPVGLNAPEQNELSEVKRHFAKALPNIDDTVLTVLSSINDGLNTNTEFSNELAELLKKYQLWEA